MATPQERRSSKALTVAAIAPFSGGTIGAIVLMVFAPAVALLFRIARHLAPMAAEFSALAAPSGSGQVGKAFFTALLRLIMATAGERP